MTEIYLIDQEIVCVKQTPYELESCFMSNDDIIIKLTIVDAKENDWSKVKKDRPIWINKKHIVSFNFIEQLRFVLGKINGCRKKCDSLKDQNSQRKL